MFLLTLFLGMNDDDQLCQYTAIMEVLVTMETVSTAYAGCQLSGVRYQSLSSSTIHQDSMLLLASDSDIFC